MKTIFALFISTFFIAHQAWAGLSSIDFIKSTISRYQNAPAVSAQVQKSVKLVLLDETKVSDGTFLFSKGSLRLEIQNPEPSLVVMNENTVWVVTPTSKELGGKTQVLKIKANKNQQTIKAPLAALLSDPKAWDQFRAQKSSTSGGVIHITLVPKKPDTMGEVLLVNVYIDKKKQEIQKFSYKDELDNETEFNFKKTNFKAAAEKSKFVYLPPANAEVTEY